MKIVVSSLATEKAVQAQRQFRISCSSTEYRFLTNLVPEVCNHTCAEV
jgi:hypothetical protein